MKTDDLIRALAADQKTIAAPPGRILPLALAGGFALAAVLFFAKIGLRPDFMTHLSSVRFDFKFVVALILAASAAVLVLRLARPGAAVSAFVLLAAPVALAIGIGLELMAVPSADWGRRLIGRNATFCLVNLPMLAAPVLLAILLALRHGAPTRPALTGAAAGLLAGGLGAFLYAAHCPDDSPLFIATWYSLAILIVTAAGALIGHRLLRW